MGFPILARWHLYIESGPWVQCAFSYACIMYIMYHKAEYNRDLNRLEEVNISNEMPFYPDEKLSVSVLVICIEICWTSIRHCLPYYNYQPSYTKIGNLVILWVGSKWNRETLRRAFSRGEKSATSYGAKSQLSCGMYIGPLPTPRRGSSNPVCKHWFMSIITIF